MPKQKTKKAAAKRLKVTASGKIKRSSPGRGHLFASKTAKQKRRLRAGGLVAKADQSRMRVLLPK